MAKVTILPAIDPQWLEVAFWIAGANWVMWRSDFDYAGPYNQMPVLANQNRFLTFISEYSRLQRQTGIARLGVSTAIVNSNLNVAFGDRTGAEIDLLAQSLKISGGTQNKELSLLSKFAAFAEPGTFNAYDKSARQGLSRRCRPRRRGRCWRGPAPPRTPGCRASPRR